MPEYNLGTARGKIIIDADGAEAGAKKGGKALTDLDGKAGKFSKSAGGLKAAAGVIGGAGAAVAGGFAVAVNSAATYEAKLSNIKAVSGASGQEMEKLSGLAIKLGADTKYSASDAADAITELVKAGVSVPDVMNGAAQATVALAAAGEIELPEAAAIASNAMNQFSLSADKMPGIADKIAGAANASAIDVKDFGYSLSQAGAVASLAGLSFDDTAVAIAEMGNAGIKGSDAGTSLKTFLSNLQPTTARQAEEFSNLGLYTVDLGDKLKDLAAKGIKPTSDSFEDVLFAMQKYVEKTAGIKVGTAKNTKEALKQAQTMGIVRNAFYDAQGNVKGLADIQGILADSTKDLTSEQKQASLEMLFGSDAIRAAAVLSKNGKKGYEDLATAMGKVTSEQVAATKQDNLKGSLEQLQGSVETVAIQIGQVLLPVIRQIVQFITMLINKWQGLTAGQRKVIIVVGLIVAAILLLIGIILAVAAAIAGMVAVFAAAGSIALPIIGVVAAIVAVIAIVITLAIVIYKNWDKIKAFTIKVFTAIKNFFVSIWNSVAGFFKLIFNNIKIFFQTAIAAWKTVISTGINAIKNFFSTVWNGFLALVMIPFNAIKNFFINFYKANLLIWTTALNVLKGLWTSFWNGPFGKLIIAVFNLIKAVITSFIGFWIMMFMRLVNFLKGVFVNAFVVTKAFLSKILNQILGIVLPIFNRIVSYISDKINKAKAIISTTFNIIKNAMVNAFKTANSILIGILTKIYEAITAPIRKAVEFLAPKFTKAKNDVTNTFRTIRDTIKNYLTLAYNAVKDKIDSIVSKIIGIKDRVMRTLNNAKNWLFNAGKNIIQGLIDGVVSMINSLTSKLTSITNLIPQFKGPPKKDKVLLKQNGELIMQSLISGLDNELGTLRSYLGDVTMEVPGMVGNETSASPSTTYNGNVGSPTIQKTIKIDQKNFNPVKRSDAEEIDDALQMAAALGEV